MHSECNSETYYLFIFLQSTKYKFTRQREKINEIAKMELQLERLAKISSQRQESFQKRGISLKKIMMIIYPFLIQIMQRNLHYFRPLSLKNFYIQ